MVKALEDWCLLSCFNVQFIVYDTFLNLLIHVHTIFNLGWKC